MPESNSGSYCSAGRAHRICTVQERGGDFSHTELQLENPQSKPRSHAQRPANALYKIQSIDGRYPKKRSVEPGRDESR